MLTTAAELIGSTLLVAGVAFVFWPAALMVAGVLCLLASRANA